MKKIIIAVGLLALAGCGSKDKAADPVDTSATSTTNATTVASASDAAPASFAQCAICHKVEKGAPNGVGPNLHGIVGAKAASAAGFNYSAAMKSWGQSWTEENLDKFLTNPRETVVGTKMAFNGLSDAAKRKEVIEWLKKNK